MKRVLIRTLFGLLGAAFSLNLFAAAAGSAQTPNIPVTLAPAAQSPHTSPLPQKDRPTVDLYGWLEVEAKKSTDAADAVRTLALVLSGVTVFIAVAGIIQQVNEKRWKDELRAEQAKLDVKLQEATQHNLKIISEMKSEWSKFREEQYAVAKDHLLEIKDIRSDAKERESSIRADVLHQTRNEIWGDWDKQLRTWDSQLRRQAAASLDASIAEAGSRHADLLYRVELLRFSLMAEIDGNLTSDASGEPIRNLVSKLYQHQAESLALMQLLSPDEQVICTGLGCFLDRAAEMPASFFDFLWELKKAGRFNNPESISAKLFDRLMTRRPI